MSWWGAGCVPFSRAAFFVDEAFPPVLRWGCCPSGAACLQEMKEKLDVQLGLRLWCQPITLLPDEVVVAYAAPHDRTLKHQVRGGTKDGRKVWVRWPLCGS